MFNSRLSPALVVAIIALVVATAGTATAATKILIKNSAQVKNGALEAADLSAKARKSLQGRQGPAGPAGPAGAHGAAGATGARGPSEVFVARRSGLNTPNCPAGGCDPDAVMRTLDASGRELPRHRERRDRADHVRGRRRSTASNATSTAPDTGSFQRSLHAYEAPPARHRARPEREVTWALTLPAPTTMSLSCSVGNVKFGAANAPHHRDCRSARSPRRCRDPVAQVGDAVLALEHPRALELDVLGREVVEEAASLPEQDRDQVDLELVEEAGGERELGDGGAVDQHVRSPAASRARANAVSMSST